MFIEILHSFYWILPAFYLLAALLCWLVSLSVRYRIVRLVSFQISKLLSAGVSTSRRSLILLSIIANINCLRVAASRAVLWVSILIQAVLTFLAAYCWLAFGHVLFTNPVICAPDFFGLPEGRRSPLGTLPETIPFIDDVSCAFVVLTSFIFLLSFGLMAKETHRNLPFWCGLLFLLEAFLLLAFTTSNLLVFYISFEATLFPMYLLIGAWGSRARKIRANFYFFLYTLLGSFSTLAGLLILYFSFGTLSHYALVTSLNTGGVGAEAFNAELGNLAWLLLSIGFLFKFPIFIFHLWLPEAHVEAPTIGSVILAAVLLKLGVYGFFRIPLTLLPFGTEFWAPYLLPVAILGTFYPAAVAAVQDDVKKIIAYSSVSHMSLVLVGLLTMTPEGIGGALFLSIGHGVTSGGLFAFVGLLYDRYRSRDLKYLTGLASTMPRGSLIFFILVLGNVGFPFLCNFPGELFIFIGSLKRFGILLSLLLGFGFFLTAVYSFRLFNLISFGAIKASAVRNYYDLTPEESAVLYSFGWAAVLLGFFCSPILSIFVETAVFLTI